MRCFVNCGFLIYFILLYPGELKCLTTFQIGSWRTLYTPGQCCQVRLDGSSLVPEDGQPLPYKLHFSWDLLDRAIYGEAQADVLSLVFPDPSSFIADQLHAHPGV